ncbi:hypothetical protein A2U01_0104503, partial [Trifolium medium]|nr:hypothetical protein [Trifolium medium]
GWLARRAELLCLGHLASSSCAARRVVLRNA